jgi:hypothetical protein
VSHRICIASVSGVSQQSLIDRIVPRPAVKTRLYCLGIATFTTIADRIISVTSQLSRSLYFCRLAVESLSLYFCRLAVESLSVLYIFSKINTAHTRTTHTCVSVSNLRLQLTFIDPKPETTTPSVTRTVVESTAPTIYCIYFSKSKYSSEWGMRVERR